MKILVTIIFAVSVYSGVSMANEAVINQYVNNPKEVGSAKFEYIFWDVYHATLYAPDGNYDAAQPFALSLTYLRDFDGDSIAERSAKEIKQQGFSDSEKLGEWESAMLELFPDIKKGQTITGISSEDGHALFYLDESQLGTIEDASFTQKFFDIWLSEKTSEPKLRQKLLKL